MRAEEDGVMADDTGALLFAVVLMACFLAVLVWFRLKATKGR